ncbi:hypothetical protein BKA82DRAFT_735833 [Pisolithus tinctorius]|uniref:Uncharacterized protein n=1 Tax=Pisolithus tinctorius Marx 270 TaxID=870435 RepID=A0A0C3P1P2_PISTI|nr:hypothetical protein BKA82DRAFT_735833 [Pisolithus tinctorius]KIO01254.1 hypothetical protein M404DRAFT_735833 [Pisolithus tinctorius Marx 270]
MIGLSFRFRSQRVVPWFCGSPPLGRPNGLTGTGCTLRRLFMSSCSSSHKISLILCHFCAGFDVLAPEERCYNNGSSNIEVPGLPAWPWSKKRMVIIVAESEMIVEHTMNTPGRTSRSPSTTMCIMFTRMYMGRSSTGCPP